MRTSTKLLLLLFSVSAYPAFAADIYSWTDENGERHYSDTPQEGAEEVQLSPTNTFSAPAPEPASAPLAGDEEDGAAVYDDFQITSPAQDEVLWNTAGTVTVSMSLSPRLKPGHRVRLTMDGKPIPGFRPRSLSHTMNEVERGTHSLQAAIVDARGKPLTEAEAVSFTVQQNTLLNPNNPNNIPPPVPVPLGGGGI